MLDYRSARHQTASLIAPYSGASVCLDFSQSNQYRDVLERLREGARATFVTHEPSLTSPTAAPIIQSLLNHQLHSADTASQPHSSHIGLPRHPGGWRFGQHANTSAGDLRHCSESPIPGYDLSRLWCLGWLIREDRGCRETIRQLQTAIKATFAHFLCKADDIWALFITEM